MLDELTVAVHAVWLDPGDQELLAHRGVKVSHCPESNLKLAAGVAPIPALLKLGVTVGLGTDGAASNNNLDLWGEMSLAARLHKVWGRDPTLMPAAQVVALATREGARVLGLGETTGTLTPGKGRGPDRGGPEPAPPHPPLRPLLPSGLCGPGRGRAPRHGGRPLAPL